MIYRVQRFLLMLFYIISMGALSIPLSKLVMKFSPDSLYPLIATLVLYMVLVVVLGGLIHTISYIPFHLAAAFDPIKNDIATGEINDLEELGKRISQFMTRFFNFAFLDINHAFLHTEKTGVVSFEDLPQAAPAMEQFGMLEKSKTIREILRAGKISHEQNEYHLYILPIWMGNQWLGYMGILSHKRIGRFFQKFLTEFEDNFLDDQIMQLAHISQRNSGA